MLGVANLTAAADGRESRRNPPLPYISTSTVLRRQYLLHRGGLSPSARGIESGSLASSVQRGGGAPFLIARQAPRQGYGLPQLPAAPSLTHAPSLFHSSLSLSIALPLRSHDYIIFNCLLPGECGAVEWRKCSFPRRRIRRREGTGRPGGEKAAPKKKTAPK